MDCRLRYGLLNALLKDEEVSDNFADGVAFLAGLGGSGERRR